MQEQDAVQEMHQMMTHQLPTTARTVSPTNIIAEGTTSLPSADRAHQTNSS
jgi:hypothetical protein